MSRRSILRFEAVGAEQAFLRRALIVLAGLAGLFVLGLLVWWGKTLRDSHQARRASEEGAALAAQGKFDRAIPLLITARMTAPNDMNVLRNLARSCDAMNANAKEAVRCWQTLVDSGKGTMEDRISLAAAMVKVTELAGAQRILDSLPESERQQMKVLEIQAAILRKSGRENEANRMLRAVWETKPEDADCRLKLAQLDMESPFEPLQQKAAGTLWQIAREGKSGVGPALLTLVKSLEMTPAVMSEVRSLVAAHPEIPSAERLRILEYCYKKNPAIGHDLANEEARRYAGKKPEECQEFYEWLAKLGDTGRILKDLSEPPAAGTPAGELHPREMVMHSRALYLAYTYALMNDSRWREASALAERSQSPLSVFEAEMIRATCAKGMAKSGDEMDKHLSAALASVRGARDLPAVLRVADLAEKIQRPRLALEAYATVATDSSQRLEALKHMFHLQQEMRDGDGMLHTAESILALNSSLLVYSDQLCYLRLITGTGIEAAVDELGDAQPQAVTSARPLRRLSAALACQWMGNRGEAERWLTGLEHRNLPAGARAVFAGLLTQLGRQSEAFPIAEKISTDYILPEENWFLRVAMR